jgi:RHS repeat-associated protein
MRHNYTYQAFGTLESTGGGTKNNYLFAGEYLDKELEEYALRQRLYNAEIGRFSRSDTYEGQYGEPLTLNKYIYAHDNPVLNLDPSGLFIVGSLKVQEILEEQATAKNTQTLAQYARIRGQLQTVGAAVVETFARAVESSVRVAYTLSKQFHIPTVIWGNDMPETTQHQFKALTGSGYTITNPEGNPGESSLISPLLMRTQPRPPRGGWYYNVSAQ